MTAALRPFHPIVQGWFRETLGEPSDPQMRGWPSIARGEHVLLLAPTGTGKTLAAFLWELNALVTQGLETPLANAVHVLYISPLKALNNDIHRNLELPLAQLRERFEAAGEKFPEIRVAVRTGDTPAAARAKMLRKTPHILITTPESLHIMLTSVRGRTMFSALRTVIVDEIHAVAGSKRGAHLALTLERLEALCETPPQRIGLSATQRPLDEIARFLGGLHAAEPAAFRPVTIVDCGLVKKIETRVVSPVEDLNRIEGGTIWPSIPPLLVDHIKQARTTLIFVNNRGLAERVASKVNQLAGSELALPYHGSLSRERRLLLERRLKAGELRALVSTSSLELGIDIGSVDLVIQLQSPKRVSSALQRIGRAGHTLGATSRGVMVPMFKDDALETLAIAGGVRDGDVEPTRVVQNALDVLAQIIVAAVSVEDELTSASLFDLVRRAYPYHALSRAAFDEVLAMLSGKYPSDVAAELDARIGWDRTTDRLSAARGSRLISVTSGGTIPDRGLYAAVLPDRTRLGELDEEFVHESRVGDAFQLGSSTWRISSIEHDRVIVTPAPGAPARMPFWHGEYMARSSHLSGRIGTLRREVAAARTLDDIRDIALRYGSDDATVTSMATYAHEQQVATGIVPDERALVAEHFRDEVGSVRVVLHAPFGGRVNAPWAIALAQRVRERLAQRGGARALRGGEAGIDVQVLTTDDGILLRLPDLGGAPPLDVLRGLSFAEAERRVLDEIGSSSLFGARFRMNAARALLLPRGSARRRMPLWLQRLKAADLLDAVREFPSFPIVVETYRDVLQDAFDMPALARVLRSLENGEITILDAETELPSPFAVSLQFGFVADWMYADDAPRAERRMAMLSLDRALLDDLLGSEGAGADEDLMRMLDLLLARRRGTAPKRQARDADELAVLLDRAGDLTFDELCARVVPEQRGATADETAPMAALLARGRIVAAAVPLMAARYILAESAPLYTSAVGGDAAARREILARYMTWAGPASVDDVVDRYGFAREWIEERFDEWVRAGKLVRGRFRPGAVGAVQWCTRRLVDEARRRALAEARRQVRPVDPDVFARFLLELQHVHPNTRLRGRTGVALAVEQLLGTPRPADAWERDILPARVHDYDPAALDALSASGEIVWVGGGRPVERDASRRLASIRFVRRGQARAWLPAVGEEGALPELTEPARTVRAALEAHGASFFADIQTSTGLGTIAIRDALRELVAAGLATNDSVDALRAVLRWRPVLSNVDRNAPDPTRWLPGDFVASAPIVHRRPSMRRLPKWRRPDLEGGERPWPGRWSLVHTPSILGPPAEEDALAEQVARQWLARYGVVARDWWRRERPTVSWRAIYSVLKRLEYRGEVRRGYFVRGLAGAQFAAPDAVERIRAELGAAADAAQPLLVIAAADPARIGVLALSADASAPSRELRPRGRGALVVMRGAHVLMSVEGRGRAVHVAPASDADVAAAAAAVVEHLARRGSSQRRRDIVVERIDGEVAARSRHVDAFVRAGFSRATGILRFYVGNAPSTASVSGATRS